MKNGKIASFFYNGVLFGVSLIRLNFSIEKNYTNFVGKKSGKVTIIRLQRERSIACKLNCH
jgi:predicted RNA-binding Zn-ribbon protein involved in translation (DUF1610 family)